MISLLLFKQIAQLFLAMFLGWCLVRAKLLKSEDSHVLSVVLLYVVMPCVIINAFQIDYTPEMLQGLTLSLGTDLLIHVIFFLLVFLCRRPLRLNQVEQASVIYTNAANLVIPIVSALFGKEWILFTSMFVVIQQPLLWSHCRILLSGERRISLRKIFLNVNILSILTGGALFLLRIPLPAIVQGTLNSVGSMVGPMGMIVAGMLIAEVDIRRLLAGRGVWKVVILRLLVFPAVILLVLKHSGLAALVPQGETILLISLLASSTPSAATVTQMAQVYGNDGEYAGSINVVTTLLCIVTMPIIIALYQL